MKDDRQHLQLFDLIARAWMAPAAVDHIVFNASQTAVAFGCADGTVAIAATADKSSPDARIRRAADTAQLSIQPRNGSYPGLKLADHTEGCSSAVRPYGPDNFLFAKASGRINTVSPGGTSVHLPPKASGAISAADAVTGDKALAYAVDATVHLWTPDAAFAVDLPAPVSTLRYSPDGLTLAIGYDGGVLLWSANAEATVPLPGCPVAVVWSGDGRSMACCLAKDGLAVIDLATRACTLRGNFPAPVTSAGFGHLQDKVAASGAFRVAAWALDGAAFTTGKSGLVLVDAVATSPNRNLVAVGYANGLLSLAEIGRADEILLRQDTGIGISALTWSANGRFLGVGGPDGTAALIEFPDSMFKS